MCMEIFEVMTPEGQTEKETRDRILESIDYEYHGTVRDQIYKLNLFLSLCVIHE